MSRDGEHEHAAWMDGEKQLQKRMCDNTRDLLVRIHRSHILLMPRSQVVLSEVSSRQSSSFHSVVTMEIVVVIDVWDGSITTSFRNLMASSNSFEWGVNQ